MIPTDIFVFGSNLAGRHGKGAALVARQSFGAVYGVAEGLTGRAYAIPTKNSRFQTLPLAEVEQHVDSFVRFARRNPQYRFLLTPVGTGLAGLKKRDIWAMLVRLGLPENVVLTSSWVGDPQPKTSDLLS